MRGILIGAIHKNFNSHAHVERDYEICVKIMTYHISTHTLTWSVTNDKGGLHNNMQFQLTRSRGA